MKVVFDVVIYGEVMVMFVVMELGYFVYVG